MSTTSTLERNVMETIDPRFNEIGWGHLYDHPDWIVPCGQCGAEAGQPC